MTDTTTIRMTSLATCAGCAAKISPEALSGILPSFAGHTDDRLIVGLQTSDDAAVYRMSADIAVVQTTDFFTPIVDDPWTFGAIAAANAMSDVYAMGGDVRFALNIAAFPDSLPADALNAILAGGAAKVSEAGGVIAGGHTITTLEPIYGLSVTGEVHPDRVWTKAGARPGDVLFLSKRIGAGVISTTLKNQAAAPSFGDAAIASMLTLNRAASEFARAWEISSCTDVTGYSLAGHAHEVAVRSGVRIAIDAGRIPLLEGAIEAVELGQIPGGLTRNQRYFTGQGVRMASEVPAELATLCFDPQTSGGLLFTIAAAEATRFEEAADRQSIALWRIGIVTEGEGVEILA
jgi:selenide,water dikinase